MASKPVKSRSTMKNLISSRSRASGMRLVGATDSSKTENEEMDWMKTRALSKPEDQLELPDSELKEDIPRILTLKTPRQAQGLVMWSYKDSAYVPQPQPPPGIELLYVPSTSFHRNSEEAQDQIEYWGKAGVITVHEAMTVKTVRREVKKKSKAEVGDEDDEEGGEEEEEGEGEGDEEEEGKTRKRSAAGEEEELEEGEEEGVEGEEEVEEEERKEETKGEEEVDEVGGGDVPKEKRKKKVKKTKIRTVCEEAEEDEDEEECVEEEEETETEEETDEEPEDDGKRRKRVRPQKKVANQFNFSERAALTYNNPLRIMSTQTEPPPRETFSTQVMQWIIYDAYNEDFEAKQAEREKDNKVATKQFGKPAEKKKDDSKDPNSTSNRTMRAAKILERMINQNTYDEIAKDCRYYEDASDEFREQEGTLLPLWKFSFVNTKKYHVTNICWNTRYNDLFAVCYGYFEFLKQINGGAVCLYTMKNPSFPEYVLETNCSVMTAKFHPTESHLLAIGMYDGSVAVYNLQIHQSAPVYKSSDVGNKHTDIVWEVTWGADTADGEYNFYTVSNDGNVFHWILGSSKLQLTKVVSLIIDNQPVAGPDGTIFTIKGCGTALAFHPKDPSVFLVGTEEGRVLKCSTEYTSMFLLTYQAHTMPIHRIDYNRFNPDIFITCSADWRIKIWEDNRMEPLFMFDLHCSVGDVEWAPYSSTVFAAVTLDGKAHVYDLNANRYQPICMQNIVGKKKNRLTRLAFNPKHPMLMVGDERGTVTSLKLSPNLRVKPKPTKKQAHLTELDLELLKLDRLLSTVREPNKLERPPDIPPQPE